MPMQDWGMPLAVLGLLLATLLMASVVTRYQAHLVRVRAGIRRLETAALQLADALAALRGVPLSRELRVMLRSDILARYRRIRGLYRRYPGIQERIREAQSALDAEGPAGAGGVGPMEDEQAFRRVVAALDALLGALAPGGTLRPVPADVCAIFRRELGERRAEAMSRFHLVESRRLETAGRTTRARAHLTTLLHVLGRRGPSTDFVRELYAEAQSALSGLRRRQRGEAETAAGPAAELAPPGAGVLARRLAG